MSLRRAALIGTFAVAALLLPGSGAAALQAGLEYPVKANYLVRFAAFVDWPPTAFATAQSPMVICVVGRDPFGSVLDRAAAAQTAHGRPLAIRRPATRAAAAGCHIIYLGRGGGELIAPRETLPGSLVVTDAASGPARGAVHFAISDDRVRFHINNRSAQRSGLSISSRLLNLALTVEGR